MIEETIKQFALEAGAKVVGIASAEDYDATAPEGHRTKEILAGARSIIVFGGPSSIISAYKSKSSRVMGVNRSFNLSTREVIARKLALFLEEKYGAYSVQTGLIETGWNPIISDKLCAEVAGLGTRAMAGGVVLNPQYGLIGIGSLITTLELNADKPMTEAVCPHPSCIKIWERKGKTPCLQACPDCLSGELENGRIKWMTYRRYICATRAQTTSHRSFQKMLYEILQEENKEKQKMMVFGSYFSRIIDNITSGKEITAQCSKCVMVCPVVLKHGKH